MGAILQVQLVLLCCDTFEDNILHELLNRLALADLRYGGDLKSQPIPIGSLLFLVILRFYEGSNVLPADDLIGLQLLYDVALEVRYVLIIADGSVRLLPRRPPVQNFRFEAMNEPLDP